MLKLNEEMKGPSVKTCMRRECIVTEPGLMDCPGCPRTKWCSQVRHHLFESVNRF